MRIAIFAAAASIAAASAAPGDDLPRLTRLAEGVYSYEHVDPTKRGVTVNNLVVVTSEGVVVADGQGTVDNTRQLVDDIARITPQPIRYVVVGSVHGDHRGGDAGFPPSASFVKEKRQLTLGGREIQVLFLGRAHTGSDLEVYLPREKILYMSESFSNGIFPSLANGYPSEWIAVLERAEQMDVEVYVPAHATVAGPRLQTSRAAVHTYRLALERVLAEGRRLHAAGVSVDDAPKSADFGEFGTWWRVQENAPGALKRVYMELDGQLKEQW
jgi:glyoxylase-like metal-dependent hydrolase (beta-lactamase superfamily II)